VQLELPALGDLNRWQRDGLACALGGELLLLVPIQYRLGVVRDTTGTAHVLFACEPCLERVVKEAHADGP
jgi:hypothetical protein